MELTASCRLGWGRRLRRTRPGPVFGDLTALYDLAAPYLLGQVESEERVLVVMNNDGGRIFDHLPRLQQMSETARNWITAPHGRTLENWAKMWGLHYLPIKVREDCDGLESLEKGTTLVEVIPSKGQTEDFWEEWRR